MSDDQVPKASDSQPGFCSATCVDKVSLREEIKKAPNTSDVYYTCHLPKRFDHPHWFNGYGSQKSKQHPLYRTSAMEYGWYPPGIHSVPSVFFPAGQTFTNRLAAAGMYRNYSLNTGMDPAGKQQLHEYIAALSRRQRCIHAAVNVDMTIFHAHTLYIWNVRRDRRVPVPICCS